MTQEITLSVLQLVEQFPDFDVSSLPAIPPHWCDESWHNDAAPSFRCEDYRIYVDHKDPSDREVDGAARFAVHFDQNEQVSSPARLVIETDDWSEVLSTILGQTFANACFKSFSDEQMSQIRSRNASQAYAGSVCATHDFADANEIMAEAFETVMGRSLLAEDREPDEADVLLWGSAWDHAKETRLSAGAR